MASTKAEIRKKALLARDAIGHEARAIYASRLAEVGTRLVLDRSAAGKRPVTSLYVPIGSEPDTMPLAAALRVADVPLALPVDWSHGSPLVYRLWVPGDRLLAGPLGISEPLEHAPELEPDVLFVPLVAFDRRGHRIGYGAGNVDRTITLLRGRKSVRVIGVAHAVQEEPLIPVAPHDEAMDLIVTDRDIIACRADAS